MHKITYLIDNHSITLGRNMLYIKNYVLMNVW